MLTRYLTVKSTKKLGGFSPPSPPIAYTHGLGGGGERTLGLAAGGGGEGSLGLAAGGGGGEGFLCLASAAGGGGGEGSLA